jgi:hypothetical protein
VKFGAKLGLALNELVTIIHQAKGQRVVGPGRK